MHARQFSIDGLTGQVVAAVSGYWTGPFRAPCRADCPTDTGALSLWIPNLNEKNES